MDRTPYGGSRQAGLLEVPLGYASRGWRVLPLWRPKNGVCTCPKAAGCDRPGKHPRTHHGHADASTDQKKIAQWKWESANIGIATGRESGLVVIDIDPRNGGQQSILDLQKRLGSLPAGPKVKTGGGGWHLYFGHPGQPIRSIKPALGIDIKADGGFVVAPPSVHQTGNTYD